MANNILLFTDQTALIISSVFAGILLKFLSLPTAISWVAAMPLIAAFIIWLLPQEEKIKIEKTSLTKEVEKLTEKIKNGYEFINQKKLLIYGFLLIILHLL